MKKGIKAFPLCMEEYERDPTKEDEDEDKDAKPVGFGDELMLAPV
jgi:hypothetical protein